MKYKIEIELTDNFPNADQKTAFEFVGDLKDFIGHNYGQVELHTIRPIFGEQGK